MTRKYKLLHGLRIANRLTRLVTTVLSHVTHFLQSTWREENLIDHSQKL